MSGSDPEPEPGPKLGPSPDPNSDPSPNPSPKPYLDPNPNLKPDPILTLTPTQPRPGVPGVRVGVGPPPTFQKTVSKSVPWNFSGMPEVDSLGPSSVTNSSKSTCPSPAGHGAGRHPDTGTGASVSPVPPKCGP